MDLADYCKTHGEFVRCSTHSHVFQLVPVESPATERAVGGALGNTPNSAHVMYNDSHGAFQGASLRGADCDGGAACYASPWGVWCDWRTSSIVRHEPCQKGRTASHLISETFDEWFNASL